MSESKTGPNEFFTARVLVMVRVRVWVRVNVRMPVMVRVS